MRVLRHKNIRDIQYIYLSHTASTQTHTHVILVLKNTHTRTHGLVNACSYWVYRTLKLNHFLFCSYWLVVCGEVEVTLVCRWLQDCKSLWALVRAVLLADSGLQGYVVYIALTEVDRPLEPNAFNFTFFMHLHFVWISWKSQKIPKKLILFCFKEN